MRFERTQRDTMLMMNHGLIHDDDDDGSFGRRVEACGRRRDSDCGIKTQRLAVIARSSAAGGKEDIDDDDDDDVNPSERRQSSRLDTIAPMSDALYPRWLDKIPTFFGRTNPFTALLLFYTGAMLRESREAPIVGAQWLLLVVLPTFGALYFARKWWYENKTKPAYDGVSQPFEFERACRSAWIDFHIGYMLLVPAGAYGGEGSSWWVMTAPIMMLARWIGGRRGKIFKRVKRVAVVMFGVVGLATLLMSASTTLVKALGALRGGGALGLALGPFAMCMSYVFYLAPASLIPRAIVRAWNGTLDDDVNDRAAIEEAEAKAKRDAEKTPEELAKEKRRKRVNLIVGFAAFGATLATGSDLPLLILFAFQLLKVHPEELMNAVINKGSPERLEMEQALADKFAGVFSTTKKNGDEADDEKTGEGKDSSSFDSTVATTVVESKSEDEDPAPASVK
jgi:hypothetical protein